ncbi:cytochrome P450 [Modicisalibacter xianhensis]|uniref:Fatty-acid peroxygenase n=1 Tax=Modicisalibacter xianhensis TaxID=442341 RepID=A0A1I3GH65_9GAMM|nr:cytochrome P450 [Halomonas xianhensis]SFI22855.1 fatty-acid peroxygenase [Halomonas xianhensis]
MVYIPLDSSRESSVALLREGNTFISTRCERYDTDIFRARLMMEKTICLRGEAAARLFYDEQRFTREGAAPGLLVKTLFGVGGVQGLDGEAHRVRKRMFMDLMSDADIKELTHFAVEEWQQAIKSWQRQTQVVLHSAVQRIHFRAACRWAGVPVDEDAVDTRCAEQAAMIDGAGGVASRHWQARRARKHSEAWMAALVEQVRGNRIQVDEDRALFRVSWHRDVQGDLLKPQVAAVELLNLLRPTVAIARFVTFAALALHEHPGWHETLRQDDTWLEPFVQEVRRLYGFFPFLAARVREDFEWNGYRFPKGGRVMLDLFGTNRDPRSWAQPDEFRPERYEREAINAYNFIPQGGGEHAVNHRCPGEWFTIALIKEGVRQLTRHMTYEVPQQDLRIDWSRMPIIPESRFVIASIRPTATP